MLNRELQTNDKIGTGSQPQPARRLILSARWSLFLAITFSIAAGILFVLKPSAITTTLGIFQCMLLVSAIIYFLSVQFGWQHLHNAVIWLNGMLMALVTAVIFPTFPALPILFILGTVCYGLGVSNRLTMYWGSLFALGTLVIAMLISLFAAQILPVGIGIRELSWPLQAVLVLVTILTVTEHIRRLWLHFNHTESVFAALRTANSELDLAHKNLEHHVRAQTELLDVSRVISSPLELEPLLDALLIQFKRVVRYESAALFVLEGEEMRMIRHRGELADQIQVLAQRLPATHLWANALRIDQPIQNYELFADKCTDCTSQGILSWMGIPLVVRGCAIGLLLITRIEPGVFTLEDSELSRAFANQAAVAIDGSRDKAAAVAAATMTERNRLARELHDSVSQSLFGMVLMTHTSLELLDADPTRARSSMSSLLGLANNALTDMRALVFELRPEFLKEEGLVAALRKQLTTLVHEQPIDLQLNLCNEPSLSLAAKEALYRVALEGMQNAVRHSSARKIEVTLVSTDTLVSLLIADDGRGFDTSKTFSGHFGLKTMRERIELLHGTFAMESAVGVGTKIRVMLPVALANS